MEEKEKWVETKKTLGFAAKNIFSILGMVFAFVFSPAGLILSIIGRNKAKQEQDESSAKLAKIGIILSIIILVVEVITVCVSLAIAAKTAQDAFSLIPRH